MSHEISLLFLHNQLIPHPPDIDDLHAGIPLQVAPQFGGGGIQFKKLGG